MTSEVIKEFLIDAYENLDRLDVELVALEQDPQDKARLASAFRTVHTIKGAAGFLAFKRLESITHVGENILSKMRDGKILLDQEITSALLQLIDAIREIATHIEQTEQEPEKEYADLVERLKALDARGLSPVQPAPPAVQAVAAPAPTAPAPTAAAPAAPAPVASTPAPVATPDAPKTPAPSTPASVGEANAAPKVAEVAPSPLVTKETPASQADSRDRRAGDDRRSDDRRGAAVAETALRVDVDLLDKLMNLVGELVLARNQILQLTGDQTDGNLLRATQRLNLVTSDLQEGVMKTRMQPIGNVWSKFPRVVRDVATVCGKQVRIEMEGKETDLDKTIIEAIKDPLTHIVRNSVDHGIELPEVRVQRGKPAEGLLLLRAFHEGGQINIEIIDDGAGIDPERIRATAVRKGVVTAEQAARMSDHEAIRLLFAPGFSTAEKVTNISGRGVGMDVVKTNIEKIGGQVDILSKVGEGTTIKIKIPLTLAIIPALVVTAADGARYAIPQVNLLELVRLDLSGASPIEHIGNAPFYRLRGDLLPLVYLHQELALETSADERDALNVVVLKADGRQFGLVVDRINDTEEIVVKPLSKHFKQVAVFAGATIMGDGTVALILDVMALAQRSGVVKGHTAGTMEQHEVAEQTADSGESLLLFSAGDHPTMAIPLSCVTRLEDFADSRVERSGSYEVVQYGSDIMPLVTMWPGSGASASGSRKAIVLNVDGSHAALVVDRVLDIVHDTFDVRPIASTHGVRGSAVIQQRVAEIVDVETVVSTAREMLAGRAA